MKAAKRMGFSDEYIAKCWGMSMKEVFAMRKARGIFPVYKMIDTCASEFESYVPYFTPRMREKTRRATTAKPKSSFWAADRYA